MRVVNKIALAMFGCSAMLAVPFWGQADDGGNLEVQRKRLVETRACIKCDLSGINLNRENLPGVNLEGANLSQARFHLATLTHANLRNCNLQGAEFGGADLSGADLRGAKVVGATFAGAYLQGVLLDPGIDLAQITSAPVGETEGQGGVNTVTESAEVKGTVDETPDSTPELASVPTQVVVEEKGFFASTIEGVQDFFTPEKGDEQPEKEKVVEVTRSQEVIPQSQVAEEEKSPAAVSVEQVAEVPPAVKQEEPGFFDNTVLNVKNFFGAQEKGTGQENLVDEKEKEAQPVAQKEQDVVNAEVTGEVPPLTEPEKQTTASTVPVHADPPANNQVAGAKDPSQVESQSVEKGGIFDRTFAGVKGLFGAGESTDSADGAKSNESSPSSSGHVGPPVEVASALEVKNDSQQPVASNAPMPVVTDVAKNIERLLDTKRCYDCDLKGADLSGKNLDEVDLEGSDLTGSKLVGIDLEGANLKGVVLSGADLRNANLKGADLYKANLSNADLTGANLDGALLDDVELTGTLGYQDPAK